MRFIVQKKRKNICEELKENGLNIPVNNSNKKEFVELVALYNIHTRIRMQIDALLEGIYEMIPIELMTIINSEELQLLL